MWEEIFKWLDEHYHGFAILFVGMGAAFAIASLYYKWIGRVKVVEANCEKSKGQIENTLLPTMMSLEKNLLFLTDKTNWVNEKAELRSAALDGRINRLVDRDNKLDDKIDKLSIKVDRVCERVDLVCHRFDRLIVHLGAKDETIDVSMFLTKSPIQLSAFAERVLGVTGGKEFVDNNLEALIKDMDLQKIKTALDAQIWSSESILLIPIPPPTPPALP